jgi:transcriptional regulator with XRE-family HTH domain
MTQSQVILKRLKTKLQATSYRVAATLDVTRQAVSQWENGRTHMDESTVWKVAAILEEPPEALLAQLAADKSKDGETAKHWLALARKLQRAAAAVGAVGVITALALHTSAVCIL